MAKKERTIKLKLIDKIFKRASESTIGMCSLCLRAGQIFNSKGYTLMNMMLACPICNETKGRLLSRKEMFEIGLILQKVWHKKLKEKDYATT